MSTSTRQVIVVSGGAAGIVTATAAGAAGARAAPLEKNEKLGKRIYVTGEGRCNLANTAPIREAQAQVVSNPHLLYSTFQAFTNEDMMRFFESAGCLLKVECSDQAFPVGNHTSNVIHALEQEMQTVGVRVSLHVKVRKFLFAGEGETRVVMGVVLTSGEGLSADAVTPATGSISYPATGSTGDSYRFTEVMGMAVTKCYPFLTPLILKRQESCAAVQGLSLRNVTITLKDGKKKVYEGFGETPSTHFGMSGSLLFSANALVGPLLRTKKELELRINLRPTLTEKQPERKLLREFDTSKNKDLKNILPSSFPQSLISGVLRQSGIFGERKARDITKTERAAFRQATKSLRFAATGLRGYNRTVTIKSGASMRSLSPATLESRTMKEPYLVGELLDLDAVTGGFNLQIT